MGSLSRRWLPVACMLMAPVGLLILLRTRTSLDVRWFSAYWHLVIVSAIAACALVIAAVASATAVRTRKAAVVWLGAGCMIVGVAMLGHGLTTPGVWGREFNTWVGRLPYLAILGLTLGLVGAGISPQRTVNRLIVRRPFTALALAVGPVMALTAVVVIDSTRFAGTAPLAGEDGALDALSLACGLLLSIALATHWKRWQLGHDVVQLAVAFAAAMGIAALGAFEFGVFQHISWWDYHAYLLAGFGMTAFAVIARGKRALAVTDVLKQTFNDDPFVAIASGYPEALRSMVRAVEVKDAYTHGHSERTARLAVELGQRLRLSPDKLRIIARGAYLHDLGKIGIPDEILNKPGRLTEQERAVIETHPQLGYEIASAARSLEEALPVILHHHERLDGHGYPAGLVGNEIPLEARVVTVADVWDALTSRRAYRDPMRHADALAHIIAGSGTHFDEAVVEALVAHLAETNGLRVKGEGTAEEAWQAAESCHEIDDMPIAA